MEPPGAPEPIMYWMKDLPDPRPGLPTEQAQLDQLESEAIRELYQVVSPEFRKGARIFVEEDEALVGKALGVPGSKRGAELLYLIYAIREQRTSLDRSQKGMAYPRQYPARVTVALVDSLFRPDIAAKVVRHSGTNEVFITRSGLSPRNLAAALEIISSLRVRDGDYPHLETVSLVSPIRSPRLPLRHLALAEAAVAQLRKTPELVEFRRLGRLPTAWVVLPPEP